MYNMTIYLIRHGETDLNKEHRLQGHSDIELNDYGRELARITGQALSTVNFDYVFTSPLIRAKETAQILVDNQEVKAPIIEDERIKEICFGEFEGLSYSKDGFTIPDKTFMNFFDKPEEYNIPEKGEGFEDVIERTGSFLKELTENKKYENKTILVSTHGCALKAILANINNISIKNFWGKGVHRNCAVSIVNICGGKIEVEEGKVF